MHCSKQMLVDEELSVSWRWESCFQGPKVSWSWLGEGGGVVETAVTDSPCSNIISPQPFARPFLTAPLSRQREDEKGWALWGCPKPPHSGGLNPRQQGRELKWTIQHTTIKCRKRDGMRHEMVP